MDILNNYAKDEGDVVKVIHNDENVVTLIYLQLKEQPLMYQNFGEVIQLDGTYQVTKLGMTLYTLLLEDNFGKGQPVVYFFVNEETTENITCDLQLFAAVVS